KTPGSAAPLPRGCTIRPIFAGVYESHQVDGVGERPPAVGADDFHADVLFDAAGNRKAFAELGFAVEVPGFPGLAVANHPDAQQARRVDSHDAGGGDLGAVADAPALPDPTDGEVDEASLRDERSPSLQGLGDGRDVAPAGEDAVPD